MVCWYHMCVGEGHEGRRVGREGERGREEVRERGTEKEDTVLSEFCNNRFHDLIGILVNLLKHLMV